MALPSAGTVAHRPSCVILPPARVIVLMGINNHYAHENHTRLLNDPDYRLIAHNPELHDGCAIFKNATISETHPCYGADYAESR